MDHFRIEKHYAKAERISHISYNGCHLGSNIFRTCLFRYEGDQLVLLHGFQKKTQKTPEREIRRAVVYRDDFISQQEEDNQ